MAATALHFPFLKSKASTEFSPKPASIRSFLLPPSSVAVPHFRLPRIVLAAVAQEEAFASIVEADASAEAVPGEPAEGVKDGLSKTKLYFGNLPYNCDSAQLAGLIQEHAAPEMVEVLYDRETGRSRGFGFAIMNSVEDCELIINKLDGAEFSGRILRVNFSDRPKAKEPLYPDTEHKLFVGNLAWTVTAESLSKMFQQYGEVAGARVIYDGETGKSRGFGFVSYYNKEDMNAALESLNGVELEGREIRVNMALGKRS